mgnify:CR=1 FL=1
MIKTVVRLLAKKIYPILLEIKDKKDVVAWGKLDNIYTRLSKLDKLDDIYNKIPAPASSIKTNGKITVNSGETKYLPSATLERGVFIVVDKNNSGTIWLQTLNSGIPLSPDYIVGIFIEIDNTNKICLTTDVDNQVAYYMGL